MKFNHCLTPRAFVEPSQRSEPISLSLLALVREAIEITVPYPEHVVTPCEASVKLLV